MVLPGQLWRVSLLCSALVVFPAYYTHAEPFTSQSATSQSGASAVADGDQQDASTVVVAPAEGAIPVTLSEGKTGTKFIIGENLKPGDYKIQRLVNPERIIVDLYGQNSKTTKSFEVSGSQMVAKVRVASHPDKNRIVFDLKTSPAPHLDSLEQGKLVVALSSGGASVVAKQQKAIPQEKIMPVAADVQAKEYKVSSVRIESAPEGGNRVVADVAKGATFSLDKSAPSEYVLRIKGAALDPSAATTVLAPASSGSIRSVRPVAQGKDVLLRLFVAPESSLRAATEGDAIVLSSVSARDAARNEMMAQAAPELLKDTSKSAAKEVKKEAATKEVKAEKAKEESKSSDASKSEVTPAALPDADRIALALDEGSKYTGRLISLDLQDTDIDNALRIIAEVSNLNIIASEDVKGKITLRLIDVPWDQALDVILKTNGLDKVQEGNVVRIAPVEKLRQEREALKQAIVAEQELEPLNVEYIRVSYAKASELKALVDSVLSERGSSVYDERTNQIIVKDIKLGLRNVSKLVAKLDLRTPQILLESQIVESSRGLVRDLGSSFDFDFRMTPATGNQTGYNFPNSVIFGGGAPTAGTASSFNAGVNITSGSSVALALGSADGTRSLSAVLSALESEGRVRVISRPSVATTNNKQATIKAVEKIRVKLPSGGLSVATGSGASAAGNGGAGTETFEVGITLNVTPQASPDYYVLLDIDAKSSTLGKERVDGIPSEVERSATSTVLVSSGQTFVMGGIYKIQEKNDVSGVPFLKDVPVLGTLFRRLKTDNSDDEIIFFVTPRIIEGSFDDAAMRAAS